MSKLTRIIIAVLFGTVTATGFLFEGCRQEMAQEGLTFAVGGAPAELDFWQVLLKDFEQQTGIKVVLLRQPTDTDLRRQGLVTSLKAAKSSPDVFLMDVAWIAQFAASDWLEPLDAYMAKEQLDKKVFFEKVVNLSDTYDNKILALPVYVDGGLLYYRKDLLAKYGITQPPQTWRKLVDDCLKVQAAMRKDNPEFYGFVWQGAQYEGLVCNWLEMAGSNNGGIFINGNTIELATEKNIEATEFMSDLIHTYKVSPLNTYTEMKEEQTRIFFQQGNAMFERNWPYAWALHQSAGSPVKDKVGIAALPHFPHGRSVSVLGGWHIGISRYSEDKTRAFMLLKFILSYNVQKKLALNLGWNPGRRDVYEDQEVLANLPHFAALRQIFEDLLARPSVPYYTLISEILQRNLNAVLSQKLSPVEALKAAQSETSEIVTRYGSR
jgi:multiple sugar transport system substrate-binding protein